LSENNFQDDDDPDVLDDELMISLSKVIEIHSQQNVSMWKWKTFEKQDDNYKS
jgi:hypothetical protein